MTVGTMLVEDEDCCPQAKLAREMASKKRAAFFMLTFLVEGVGDSRISLGTETRSRRSTGTT
jgi:hypothetical protein